MRPPDYRRACTPTVGPPRGATPTTNGALPVSHRSHPLHQPTRVTESPPCLHGLRLNGVALGPTNPERTILPPEPCGLRRGRFSRPFALLIPAFALPRGPWPLPPPLHPPRDAPLPWSPRGPFAVSVDRLAPYITGAAQLRPVSYYALFQGWLLLSQPPGCLGRATTLPTQRSLGDLNGRSGLLPS